MKEDFKIKSSNDLQKILDEKEVTATWLAMKLGYSSSWMYKCIHLENESQIDRMVKILKGVK